MFFSFFHLLLQREVLARVRQQISSQLAHKHMTISQKLVTALLFPKMNLSLLREKTHRDSTELSLSVFAITIQKRKDLNSFHN